MSQKTANVRVIGIKATTIAMVQATFMALVGLVIAISFMVSSGIEATQESQSLLRGLTFGLANGLLALVLVPLIYFVIGWLIGLIQGVIINGVVRLSGGVIVTTKQED